MEDLNKVCRICLNVIYNQNLINMDKLMNNKLQVILPDMIPQLSHNYVVCCGCLNSLDECYNFKNICFKANDIIRQKISRIESNQKLELGDIMLWTGSTPNPLKNDSENICRTCLSSYKKKYQIEDVKVLYLLEKHFPELDLNLSLNPDICETCTINLYKLNYFKMVYLNTNNIVNSYCKMFDIDYKNVNLIKVLEFNKKHKKRSSTSHSETDKNGFMEAYEESDAKPISKKVKKKETKEENIPQPNEDEHSCETIKSVEDNNEYSCPKCKKIVKDIEKHLSEHKEDQLKFMYKCNKCDYENTFKYKLKRHLLSHKRKFEKGVYKCMHCSFQATNKGRLSTHVLIHKKPDEIEMFKCQMCNFQSRQKGNLKIHLLIHEKEKKFKCNYCSFGARQKGNLRTHMLRKHNYLEENELEEALSYKCNRCSYKTMYRNVLKKHIMRNHDD